MNGNVYKFENTLFGDTAIGKTFSADALYFLESDTVFNFQGIPYSIKISDSLKTKKLIWGSIYYTGFSKKQNNLFFLVTDTVNNKLKILADKNGDLDFTNEEVETFESKNQFYVTVKNNEPQFEKFKVLINIFSAEKSKQIAGINNQFKVTPKHNSKMYRIVQQIRWNYKKTVLSDSNVVYIQDYDCNGQFNNIKDKIYTYNPLIEKEVSLKQSSYYKKGYLLPFKNKSYELIEIDKFGSTIELKQTSTIIDLTNYFINIKLKDLSNSKTDFIELPKPKKITVLYFWGTWCSPCLHQTELISAFYNSNKSSINFFSIHYGENIEVIKNYKALKNIQFPIFIIDDTNLKINKIESFPFFMLIDENGIIIKEFKNINNVEKYLSSISPNSIDSIALTR
jgi:thiol-disulfide isomerase/thioredoxin